MRRSSPRRSSDSKGPAPVRRIQRTNLVLLFYKSFHPSGLGLELPKRRRGVHSAQLKGHSVHDVKTVHSRYVKLSIIDYCVDNRCFRFEEKNIRHVSWRNTIACRRTAIRHRTVCRTHDRQSCLRRFS